MVRWYVMPTELVVVGGRNTLRPTVLHSFERDLGVAETSASNPCVLNTISAHGLESGEFVSVLLIDPTDADVPKKRVISTNGYITVIDANGFSIPFDSSALITQGVPWGAVAVSLLRRVIRLGWMKLQDNWSIGYVNLTAADHATYNASAGVRFLTADLDATLGAGAVTAVRNELSARNLPSAWVNNTLTWRLTIKRTLAFLMLIQRFWGETQQILNIGRPVETPVSSLNQTTRDKLDIVWRTFPGGSLPAIEAGDTIEIMMMRWADVLITRPIFVGGVGL